MTTVEPVQPYAQAYDLAHPGQAFVAHEYIVWITGQWAEWGAEAGADMTKPRTEAERDAFGAWLADRWENR